MEISVAVSKLAWLCMYMSVRVLHGCFHFDTVHVLCTVEKYTQVCVHAIVSHGCSHAVMKACFFSCLVLSVEERRRIFLRECLYFCVSAGAACFSELFPSQPSERRKTGSLILKMA